MSENVVDEREIKEINKRALKKYVIELYKLYRNKYIIELYRETIEKNYAIELHRNKGNSTWSLKGKKGYYGHFR